MTEPLKPRIDFDGPLEVDQNPKFRAQQTFDENKAQNFAPATLDEAPEEEGQVEAVMDAALRPKRSLWRKMVMGGLALFGASVVGQGTHASRLCPERTLNYRTLKNRWRAGLGKPGGRKTDAGVLYGVESGRDYSEKAD